ncbi:MAG: T9SS-dependent M36 family metallopeptidase [Bacteroidota bacterium]
MKINLLFLTFILGCLTTFVGAQSAQELADDVLKRTATNYNLSSEDLADWIVKDEHVSNVSGVHHIYVRQRYQGIEIYNADASMHVAADGKLLQHHNQFVANVANKISGIPLSLSRVGAVEAVANNMGYTISAPITVVNDFQRIDQKGILSKGGISNEDIPVQLMSYLADDGQLKLTWNLSILETGQQNWWSFRVDVNTGEILSQVNWMKTCNFHEDAFHNHSRKCVSIPAAANRRGFARQAAKVDGSTYNVYPLGVESPNHGDRQLLSEPADPTASPFGWHDTDGVAGAEFTITRGNNVHAQEDRDGNNGTGYSPDGGASLDFDFPLDLSLLPAQNEDAMITNLFYWNNAIHDVLHYYGFDEASGNFQETNYSGNGLGQDYVFADAQDGSGINNANFGTPEEGTNPRMQMFLWGGGVTATFMVNSPASISGAYTVAGASFGDEDYNVTANIVVVEDNAAPTSDGCSIVINESAVNGNIALIDRGSCDFGVKARRAQNAGAIAAIICNNEPGLFSPTGGFAGNFVDIPVIMVTQADCQTIRTEIPTVNATMVGTPIPPGIDGDVENGIIAHEYGHGISNRLTAGASNVGCLGNSEQMGEGWSDYYGLLLTMQEGDRGTDVRGIGTYAIEEPITGNGIRPFPYSTDMTVNPHTYNNINGVSIPHGVGSVWCEMLWEMTWSLIGRYGYDPDLYQGTGGNNISMALVTEGMKFQPCSPGFVDGRDAILKADTALYGGANSCLIWAAFAKRGLGLSASQGSTNNVADGVEAFDLPASVDTNGDGIADACDAFCTTTTPNTDLNFNNVPDVCESCGGLPNNITVEDTLVPPTVYRAPTDLSTQGEVVVASGTNVAFIAGNSISFQAGFAANAGSELFAIIADCPTNSTLQPKQNGENAYLAEAVVQPLAIQQPKQKGLDLTIQPNPTRGDALIQYQIPQTGKVNVGLYNATGQLMSALLTNVQQESGQIYQLTLSSGELLEGYYYLLLQTEKGSITKKLAVVK